MATWLIILTIGLPWAGVPLVWWLGDRHPRARDALAVGCAAAAGLAALALLPLSSAAVALRLPAGDVFGVLTFVPDGLGAGLAAVAAVVGCLAVLFSIDYMRGETQLGRYYALMLLFIGAMAGLVLAGSLLLLFFFWELVALCSFGLIAFHADDPRAVAGGVKALVITQVGGVGLLAGALIARAELGSDQVGALLAGAGAMRPAALALVAFGFLLAAAAKSAQLPFHTWLPDAMEAPTPVSALIHAATMVNAGVYLLARFYPAFAAVPGWTTAVIAVGLLSALLAALMALVADDLKRALAYSTISQLGVMVYAVGVGAVFAAQLHLLSHALFKALLFLAAGAVIQAAGTRDMRRMGGLGRSMPFVRDVFVVGALALAGLPLMNGFWSKDLVLEAGLAEGPRWAYLGMLAAVALTALYTFRVVWMVFGPPRGDQRPTTNDQRPTTNDQRPLGDQNPQPAIGVGRFTTETTEITEGGAGGATAAPNHALGVPSQPAPCAALVPHPSPPPALRLSPIPYHPTPITYHLSLGLLALGTLTSWLLAGPLSRMLAQSLPFHALRAATTMEICAAVLGAPATVLALGMVVLGMAAWWWRGRLGWLSGRMGWLARASASEFGFAWVNRAVARLARRAAAALRATQTGQLGWNMVGVVGALVLLLAVLAWGG